MPFLRTIFLALTGLFLTAGCQKSAAPAPAPSTTPIRIAGFYWPGVYWIDVADKKGFFKEAGLNVTVVNVDADFFGGINDFAEGKLETFEIPFFDFVRLNAEGKAAVGVIVGDYSTGAEAVVGRAGIESFKDLKGKKIGLARNTYAEYIFTVVAERNRLDLKEVEIVDLQAEKVAEEFIAGRVDAMFAWEPLQSQALKEVPGSKVLFSTAEIPGIAGGIQCFHKDFITKHPEEVRRVVQVWARASDYLRQHPEECYGIVAGVYGRPVEEVRAFMKADTILGVQENEVAFSFASGFDSIHGAARQMNDFMLDRGLTQTKLETTTMVDPSFIRALDK
jgi:NitT/TauT family transport system substrate-binding protein